MGDYIPPPPHPAHPPSRGGRGGFIPSDGLHGTGSPLHYSTASYWSLSAYSRALIGRRRLVFCQPGGRACALSLSRDLPGSSFLQDGGPDERARERGLRGCPLSLGGIWRRGKGGGEMVVPPSYSFRKVNRSPCGCKGCLEIPPPGPSRPPPSPAAHLGSET